MALGKPANDISAMVIGGHGDTTMIPLTRLASYNGIPVSSISFRRGFEKVAADTMVEELLLQVFRNISLVCARASVAYLWIVF
jgi:malate dehydrogenase